MAKDPLIFGDAACYQKIVAYYEALLLTRYQILSLVKHKQSCHPVSFVNKPPGNPGHGK